MNKVIIVGNLGRDPELKYNQSGLAICRFSLATSEKKKNGEQEVQWHRIVFFDKRAEVIAQYVKKGHKLLIEGKLQYGQYEKNGNTVYTTDIIGHNFEFLTSKKDADNGNQSYTQGVDQNPDPIDDSDIPF